MIIAFYSKKAFISEDFNNIAGKEKTNKNENDLRCLSNFSNVDIGLKNGDCVKSVEHGYVIGKLNPYSILKDDPLTPKQIAINKLSASEAKAVGRYAVAARDFYDGFDFEVLKYLVWQKFSKDEWYKDLLLNTGDNYIAHYSPWDSLHGLGNDSLTGLNLGGLLLMQVRDVLRGNECTRPINIKTAKNEEYLYIGRKNIPNNKEDSIFRNQFKLVKDTREQREEVIKKYILSTALKDWGRKEIESLKNSKLGCYCVPKICHGLWLSNISYMGYDLFKNWQEEVKAMYPNLREMLEEDKNISNQMTLF